MCLQLNAKNTLYAVYIANSQIEYTSQKIDILNPRKSSLQMHQGITQLKTIKQSKGKKVVTQSKVPPKDFQLLYRQRDQSVQKCPVESIIFVKSKRCRPEQKIKKSKVKEEFKKIMKDLDNHVSKHKKNSSQINVQPETSNKIDSHQNISKKVAKQAVMSKKNKMNIQEGKENKALSKGKTVKSPKCNKAFAFQSPRHNKQILNVKSPKNQKKGHSKSQQKLSRNGFRSQKSREKSNLRSTINSTSINDRTVLMNKKNARKHDMVEADQTKKSNRFVEKLPLRKKQDEYILVEGNFQKMDHQCLSKLETKLMSTYRIRPDSEFRVSSNKISCEATIKQTPNHFLGQNRDSAPWFQEEQVEQKEINLGHTPLQSVQAFVEHKVITIQRWWRSICERRIKCLEANIEEYQSQANLKTCRIKNESHEGEKIALVMDQVPHFPSAQSLQFGQPDSEGLIASKTFQKCQEKAKEQKLFDQKVVLQTHHNVHEHKKEIHEKRLNKMVQEQSISPEIYEQKMKVFRENQQEVNSSQNLKQVSESKTDKVSGIEAKSFESQSLVKNSDNKSAAQIFDNVSGKQQTVQEKLKQFKNRIVLKSQGAVSSEHEKESQIKEQSAQQFILSRKKTQGCHFANNQIQGRYRKHTTSQGQQYYEEVSDSSNDNSPHKALNFCDEPPIMCSGTVSPQDYDNTEINQLFSDFKQIQQIKMCIQKRVSVQMGATCEENDNIFSVNTSILAIHEFLIHFFKFYLQNYKEEFLRLINMPYGYSPIKRLKFLQGYEDESEELEEDQEGIIYGLEYIMSDEVLDEFFDNFYGSNLQSQLNPEELKMVQYTKIHAKAAFDCFNEALNQFRPYFGIGGPPYMWNCSENALTFYFISEDNLDEVFDKTQYKVLKSASSLVGLMVPELEQLTSDLSADHETREGGSLHSGNSCVEDMIGEYRSSIHPLLLESRDERITKEEQTDLIENNNKWSIIEEQKTSVLYEVSSVLLEHLALQLAKELGV